MLTTSASNYVLDGGSDIGPSPVLMVVHYVGWWDVSCCHGGAGGEMVLVVLVVAE
jgi:hypothetical protein